MDTLKTLLTAHGARYPEMQPMDAVKLIYQNEFGGGHLIRDEEKCLARLKTEYSQVTQSADEPLAEEIGNGMVRVNLRALDAHGYCAEQLGADFIRCAALQQGSPDSFRKKLDTLRQLAKEGSLPFSFDALEQYLDQYEKAGFPMVSHSPQYRAAYAPAYRVIRKEFLPL